MTFWNDVRLAARLLLKDRWFTLAAVAALALGIAANNTVFTLMNGVLLRDLSFEEPDRIVSIGVKSGPGASNPVSEMSYADLRDWQAAVRTFDGIGAYTELTLNVSDEGHAPERFAGGYLTANAFQLIGVRPILGRSFRPEDVVIFGVIALGAQARHVGWLVTRGASWQIAIGLAIGIAGSIAVSRAVPVAITQVEGTDPLTLSVSVTLLVLVALVACLIPGRRAMRLNPVEALRSE